MLAAVASRGSAAGPLGLAPGTNAPEGGRGSGGSGGSGEKLGGAPGGTRGAGAAEEWGGASEEGAGTDGNAPVGERWASGVGSRVKGLSEEGTGMGGAEGTGRGPSMRAADAEPVAGATALPASWPQAKQREPSQARPQLGQRCTVTRQA